MNTPKRWGKAFVYERGYDIGFDFDVPAPEWPNNTQVTISPTADIEALLRFVEYHKCPATGPCERCDFLARIKGTEP